MGCCAPDGLCYAVVLFLRCVLQCCIYLGRSSIDACQSTTARRTLKSSAAAFTPVTSFAHPISTFLSQLLSRAEIVLLLFLQSDAFFTPAASLARPLGDAAADAQADTTSALEVLSRYNTVLLSRLRLSSRFCSEGGEAS